VYGDGIDEISHWTAGVSAPKDRDGVKELKNSPRRRKGRGEYAEKTRDENCRLARVKGVNCRQFAVTEAQEEK